MKKIFLSLICCLALFSVNAQIDGISPSSIISFLGTPTARGLDKEIWIAVRNPTGCGSDGKTGCAGTAEDPYDGSTQAKFDAIMVGLTPMSAPVNNLFIHLGVGTFNTNGSGGSIDTGWVLGDNCRIVGSGRDATILYQQRILDNSASNRGANGVIVGGYNCTVSDLTTYCNWAALSAAHPGYATSGNFGVQLKSGLIFNQHTTGAGGTATVEIFANGFLVPSGTAPTLSVIDSSIVDQSEATANLTAFWVHAPSTGNVPAGGTAIIKNCRVDGANIAYQINGYKNCLVDGNTSINSNNGFFHDTNAITNVTITNNSFTTPASTGNAGVSLVGSYYTDTVLIAHNVLSLGTDYPNIVTDSATHVKIKDNVLIAGGTFWHPIQDNSDATTTDIEDNRFSTNTSTTLRAGSLVGRFRGNKFVDGTRYSLIADNTGIGGTTTNNNAVAGDVGELISSTLATGSSITLTTNTAANVTSISLTAGDWDVTGAVDFTFGATTSYTNLVGSISTTSATIGAQDSLFDFETPAAVPTAGADCTFAVPTVRVSIAGTTTVYLVAKGTFTVSSLKSYGTIRARRIR